MQQTFGKRGLMLPLPRPARKWILSTAKRRPRAANFGWRVTGACVLILSGFGMLWTWTTDLTKHNNGIVYLFLAGLCGIYFGLQQLTRHFLNTRKSDRQDSGRDGGGDGWIGSSDAGGCGDSCGGGDGGGGGD